MTRLSTPENDRKSVERFVVDHLAHLSCDDVAGSQRFSGGQSAADAALVAFDVTGYASERNEVYPMPRRGASALSPYIRHGLLPLERVWEHVGGGPQEDVAKFRNELLWQEYARHWYSRLGHRTATGIRNTLPAEKTADEPWNRDMACLELSVGELEDDGWLVNQSRMWLASEWAVRGGLDWQQGEDYFFRHLLDGSRAANRLGWQWTTGVGSTKTYGFSRWQVEERAPGLCASCELVHSCPIEEWPSEPQLVPTEQPVELRSDSNAEKLAGPTDTESNGDADAVWLTAESLGVMDPALAAHQDLPAVFVLDESLLRSLQLSSKRLVFLTETLAELATSREVELHLGDPVEVLAGRRLATTYAPVPGFRRRSAELDIASLHPWPWLRRPSTGTVLSFSAWLKSVG